MRASIYLFNCSKHRFSLLALSVALLAATGPSAIAATESWTGGSTVNGDWSTGANWSGGAAPGSVSVTTSTDVAIFNTAIANTWGNSAVNPVVIDQANQNIGGINFDTAAGSYFIGSAAGNPLYLTSSGTIQILNTLTATNPVETINAPLVIEGSTYTLANNSGNGTGAKDGTLVIGAGGITGGVAGPATLILAGANTNANTISGIIANGSATSLGVTMSGTGAWTISGANSYTGGTQVNGGTLTLIGNQTAANGGLGVDVTDALTSTLTIGTTTQTAPTQVAIASGTSVQVSFVGGGSTATNTLQVNGASANPSTITNNGALVLGRGSNLNLLTYSTWNQSGGMTLSANGGYSAKLQVSTNTTFNYTGSTPINYGSTSLNPSAGNGDIFTVNGANALFTTDQGIQFGQAALNGVLILENGGTLKLTANIANFATYALNGTTLTTGTSAIQLPSGAGIINTNGFNTSSLLPLVGAGSLTKSGGGILQLTGSNNYTGGTTVSGGALMLSSVGQNGALTVSSGTFDYMPAAAGPLNLGTGKITLSAGTTIGAGLGGAAGQSAITSSVAATTAAGNVTINIFGIPGVAPAAGSNNLITASSGLNTATYSLGNVYNATNFTVSGLTAAAGAVSITATPQTALASEYYAGGFASGTNVLAISDGVANSNWSTTPPASGATITPLTPGPTTTIYFTPGEIDQNGAVLGASMSVLGAQFTDTNPVTLNADGNSLTTGTGGITATGGTVTINTPLLLSGSQTWTNNSSGPLTIGGIIGGGAGSALAISGSGTTVLSSANTFAGGLYQQGTGTTVLSGSNVFTGGIFIQNGTLQVAVPVATGANTLTFGTATTSGTLDLNGQMATVNGLAVAAGANAAAQVIGNSSTTAPAILNYTVTTSTFGGTIVDAINNGTQTTGLNIASGSLTLTGSSTYSGATTVKGGTLIVNGALSGASSVTIGNAASLATTAILGGGGTVGNVTVGAAALDTGARLTPGALDNTGTGTTLTTGALTFANSSAHLYMEIGRSSAFASGVGNGGAGGDVSDHVDATGAINLNGADLHLTLLTTTGYSISAGDVLFLIINGSGSPVNGTFSSINGVATTLTEGSDFTFSGQQYMITYQANYATDSLTGGMDVALLAVVPEPSDYALLLLGAPALLLLRRRRIAQ